MFVGDPTFTTAGQAEKFRQITYVSLIVVLICYYLLWNLRAGGFLGNASA